jgi:hypothetical protein
VENILYHGDALQLLPHVASFDSEAHLSVSQAFLVWLFSVGSFGFMFAVPDNPLLKKKDGDSRPRVSQGDMWAALPAWLKTYVNGSSGLSGSHVHLGRSCPSKWWAT